MAKTPAQARDLLIETARQCCDYWSKLDGQTHEDGTPYTPRELVTGSMFMFLAALDGDGSLPACDIMMLSFDDDGDKVGETRVSAMLHERFYSDGWGK